MFKAVSGAASRYPDRYFALSAIATPEMQRRYEEAGVGVFEDPWRAVESIAAAVRAAERLAEKPLPIPPVPANLPPLPRGRIAEHEAKHILAEAGIPVLDERLVTDAGEAARVGPQIGERLVLKIVSADIPHKTEMGGVMLDIPAAEAGAAFDRMIARIKERAPRARLDGVLISPMLRGGIETILGVQNDPVFGPVVMLGLGGIFVEVLRDVTFRIAPFGIEEAHRMIGELRGRAMLEGARGQPPCDLDALAQALSNLSIFAAAKRAEFTSIDINPLLVRPKGQGAAALDALILTPDAVPGDRRGRPVRPLANSGLTSGAPDVAAPHPPGLGRFVPAACREAVAADSSPSGWQAVLVAGDNAQPVFDNAVAAVRNWLASGGVPAPNIHVLSATPVEAQKPNRPRPSASWPAIAALRPGPGEACLVFVTSHGQRGEGIWLAYSGEFLRPAELAQALSAGCARAPTVVVASGCFTGGFTALRAPNRIVVTAARADRPSFGCAVERTYAVFDECLLSSLPQEATWRALSP